MSDRSFVYFIVTMCMILAVTITAGVYDSKQADQINALRHQNMVLRDQVEDSVVDINERLTLDEREIRKYDDCVDAVVVSQVYSPALFTQCVKDIEQSQG